MRKFIGHIRCPGCGFTHIVDPRQVTIFFNFDSRQQTAQVVCFGCKQIVQSTIDEQDIYAFTSKGVKLVPWQNTLPPLTEQEINDWDIEKELDGVY